MALPWTCLLIMILCGTCLGLVGCATDPGNTAALRALMDVWKNTPPNWKRSDDPCGGWDGVRCEGRRVVALTLSSMSLQGGLTGDIAQLTELQTLDLSYNKDLTGPVPPALGALTKLSTLILAGCSFTGNIPTELGRLTGLTYLALNSNKFSGRIPPLGNLTNISWLDLADNQLSGPIPVSTPANPGLDLLVKTKHFHFNKNQLSGRIPVNLFSSEMKLIHVLFDGNQFNGEIPSSLGLVTTLEVLRLDRNSLSGTVPPTLNNLVNVKELHLSNNKLTGPAPDLTGMNSLNYVDLSNNSFDVSVAPTWFSNIQSLTTLVVENGPFHGQMPQKLFSFPQLQNINLKKNAFSGTLDMGNSISQQLQIVDLENNNISTVTVGLPGSYTLDLIGNPVCAPPSPVLNNNFCKSQQMLGKPPYTTNMARCAIKACSSDQRLSPLCECACPYEGIMFFRAPSFSDLSNATRFQSLESDLWTKLKLNPGSVTLQNLFFNTDNYLQVQLELFPSNVKYFDRADILRIGLELSNQTYKPPPEFGPYYFIASASPYPFSDGSGGAALSTAVIIGIAVGCVVLVLMLTGVGIYAFRQKKRAERAIEQSKPFASWAPSGKDSGGAPQLKGARWFSYGELKKSTNNFSESNEIGSGGYGKVYRGTLTGGQLVAIKRAQQGSMQGGLEFKTEIELLSRVHHKNLVSLIGFCFEQGEQMLVYEYVPNGTLRESLSGRTGISLDWKRRLRIALGSARGLTYLHELANPPIIHRDVKTSNILLDETLSAKVADFGLSKLISDSAKGHVSTQVKGTLGYLDPEYYMTQQLTEKSDVYSFGVVMLELVTAKQPIEKGKYIVREVRMSINTNEEHYGLKEIMDPYIRNATNLIGFGRFVELAMQCLEELAADRPTMGELVKEIEIILKNDGVNTESNSASSSATDYGPSKGGPPRHPYNEELPRKETNSDSFDYSGGYSYSAKVEPK